MKQIFSILFLFVLSFSYEINLNSNLTAICKYKDKLFVGTNSADLFSINIKDKSLKKILTLDKIENYYTSNENSTIYNIDVLDNALLIVNEGNFGYKNINLYKNNTLYKYDFNISDINKAFFINEKEIMISTIGSEVKIINIENNNTLKSIKLSESTLKDLVLNEKKDEFVVGFESGEVIVFDIKNWNIKHKFDSHKDGIYQLDFKKSKIISCSTDKNINLIINNKIKSIKENFLIYSCSLNENGTLAAYANNENSLVNIINLQDYKIIKSFKNDFSTEFIIFLDDEIVNAGYENKIVFWSLK